MSTRSTLSMLTVASALFLGTALPCYAGLEVLYKFRGTEGAYPFSLIEVSGKLLVAASGGGSQNCDGGCGVLVTLERPTAGNGQWTRTILHSFQGGSDGGSPFALEQLDNNRTTLFGVTGRGGGGRCAGGCGTVFRLDRVLGATGWTKRTIYWFEGGDDGALPAPGLAAGPGGVIYLTTILGGQRDTRCRPVASGCGAVYQLVPNSSGSYSGKIIFRFTGGNEGKEPWSGVIRSSSGVLFGTASQGGLRNSGVVYSLAPLKNGRWRQEILHSFNRGLHDDGLQPLNLGSLLRRGSGALYGTTFDGGSEVRGDVFALLPPADSGQSWDYRVLHDFKGPPRDGSGPVAGLIEDSSGALIGTTSSGGNSKNCFEGCGTIFRLTRSSPGWNYEVLHNFDGRTGREPIALIPAQGGGYFGVTLFGGSNNCPDGCGTVFKWTP